MLELCRIGPYEFDLGNPGQLRGKAPVKHSQLREKDLVVAVAELLKAKCLPGELCALAVPWKEAKAASLLCHTGP